LHADVALMPQVARIGALPAILTGALLNHRYRVVRTIGRGGMGAVYEAVDIRLHNTVAVKQLTVDGADADHAFEREAGLLAALRHPVLPVVIDYFTEDDHQFLVMQYIEGEDLAHRLQRVGSPLPIDEVMRCAVMLLGALTYLHRHDPPIIHRDIKPSNVKRTPAGEFVLLDFGLAYGQGHAEATVAVNARSIYGFTPTYSPPEQIQGLPSDIRSDVFALGATLYHLAIGVPPPPALERLARIASGQPDPLRDRLAALPDVDKSLRTMLARALALDARDRFQSAGEMEGAVGRTLSEPPPGPEVLSGTRRVDAALPSHAEVRRPIDLIVQVRFTDSPLLGVEDWVSRRRPDRIEQASDAIDVTYPSDANTGRVLPARLTVRIVAPDFATSTPTEQLIDVPPLEYSKRLAFLLTPLRAGLCRVNVEVYAADALFLGVIAVEAEALEAPGAEAAICVANLDFRVDVRVAARQAVIIRLMERAAAVGDRSAIGEFSESSPYAGVMPGRLTLATSAHDSPASTPPQFANTAKKRASLSTIVGLATVVLCVGMYVATRPFVRSAPPVVVNAPAPIHAPPLPLETKNIVADYLEAARIAIAAHDYDAARDDIEAARQLDPADQEVFAKQKEVADLIASATPQPPTFVAPKPAPSEVVDVAGIPRRANESPAEYTARASRVRTNLREGLQLLEQQELAAAISRFEAVQRDQPGYMYADALQANAAAQQKLQVDAAINNGLTNERAGNLLNAVRWYDRALQIDPTSTTVQQQLAAVAERRLKEGLLAFDRAEVLRKRNEVAKALGAYQEAATLLPPTHVKRAQAQQWMQKLKP
jgi:serine/threonine protein kinase/tetratricopeptide (TPR) repeat protein